jgi:hypothetical protein
LGAFGNAQIWAEGVGLMVSVVSNRRPATFLPHEGRGFCNKFGKNIVDSATFLPRTLRRRKGEGGRGACPPGKTESPYQRNGYRRSRFARYRSRLTRYQLWGLRPQTPDFSETMTFWGRCSVRAGSVIPPTHKRCRCLALFSLPQEPFVGCFDHRE